jgi:GntR family transcriptional regulator/MocR family aminotransferase
MKRASGSLFATIALDPSASVPLYRQLYDELRSIILSGQLQAGARLPSTRTLASELGIARSTVVTVFERLIAEGYLDGKSRGGTYVVWSLPAELPDATRTQPCTPTREPHRHSLSRRGNAVVMALQEGKIWPVASDGGRLDPAVPLAFDTVLPALDAFPYDVWHRLTSRRWRQSGPDLLRHWCGAGYYPLREAIAAYVGGTRGVRCRPEQIIVVGDGREALDLAARVLLDPGDSAWIEDPGYLISSSVLTGAGIEAIPVPVDADGLDVEAGMRLAPAARLAVVTLAPQWPLGMITPLARRLALLQWARQNDAWLFENDNDNQYPYIGQPVAALQGLDKDGCVIYYGDFINVLCAPLSVGYLVVPSDLVEAFAAAQFTQGAHASIVGQAVLADFMTEGHFTRHLRRVRRLYATRQAALLGEAHNSLDGLLEVQPAEAGPYVLGWLPTGVDDRAVAWNASQLGITVLPISAFSVAPPSRDGLLLGYAAVDAAHMADAVGRLAVAIRQTMSQSGQGKALDPDVLGRGLPS